VLDIPHVIWKMAVKMETERERGSSTVM